MTPRLAGEQSRWIAKRVRDLRLSRKWSVADLAERCASFGMPGLTANVLYLIEGPQLRKVTVDELVALALAFDLAPIDLLSPVGPRVWRHEEHFDRAQPVNVVRVRDRHNDIWTCTTTDVWFSAETVDCGWSYILRKFGPLTEVPDEQTAGETT